LNIQSSDNTPAAVYINESHDGVIMNSRCAYPLQRFWLKDQSSENIKVNDPCK